MKLLDLTFSTPQENLACDEALLQQCEEGSSAEVLRLWESSHYFVVLGYSNQHQQEIYSEICQKNGIPILRRSSGGGAVLQGPGCLNYTLILQIPEEGPLSHLVQTNHYILEKNRAALEEFFPGRLELQGISDLTLGNLKFSGNAQRRKRKFLLYHGTFLHRFDLSQIGIYLKMPSRQPEYRRKRSHENFLVNIPLEQNKIKQALQKKWNAAEKIEEVPAGLIQKLIEEKFSKNEWNLKF